MCALGVLCVECVSRVWGVVSRGNRGFMCNWVFSTLLCVRRVCCASGVCVEDVLECVGGGRESREQRLHRVTGCVQCLCGVCVGCVEDAGESCQGNRNFSF